MELDGRDLPRTGSGARHHEISIRSLSNGGGARRKLLLPNRTAGSRQPANRAPGSRVEDVPRPWTVSRHRDAGHRRKVADESTAARAKSGPRHSAPVVKVAGLRESSDDR